MIQMHLCDYLLIQPLMHLESSFQGQSHCNFEPLSADLKYQEQEFNLFNWEDPEDNRQDKIKEQVTPFNFDFTEEERHTLENFTFVNQGQAKNNQIVDKNQENGQKFTQKKRYIPKVKYDSQGNKQYVPRRIFMCGACHTRYQINQELAHHIFKNHEEIPDGTIYGIMKQKLYRFFGIPILTAGVDQRQIKYKCGCGKIYGCSSSLKIHIIKKHEGVRPPGTKGAVSRNPRVTPPSGQKAVQK